LKNKLIRLVELIQEGFSGELQEAFKAGGDQSLATRLERVSAVRDFHQQRSETLWLQAGKKRTADEKKAAAQADLAAFLFAYLSGDAKEYRDTGVEALQALGRHGEVDIVISLAKR